MRKVKIMTDSTNDLSAEVLKQYDVSVVPLYVEFGEKSYRDGVDISPDQLFHMVEENGVLPKTASPSPYDFAAFYRKYIEDGQDILVITLSAQMSSSYQNAVLAASEFPDGRIEVCDSKSLTVGIGSLVIKAGDMAQQGYGLQAISDKVRLDVASVKVNFVIDTLEYLYKGGRCNVVQNLLGTALRIRPIIGVEAGKMIIEDKVRGDKKRALDSILKNIMRDKQRIKDNLIIVVHSIGGKDEACYLRNAIQEALPYKKVDLMKAGCVISSHCGMKTVGVAYIVENDKV